MVIVESVALAIMVSNDIVMPLVLQRREDLITGRDNVGGVAADRAAGGDLRHPVPRLHVLPLGRRGAARLDRPVVFCGRRAARAGVFRRTDLAPRHRPRRHGRDDDRHPGLGLYAAAAELRRCRHRRPEHLDARARGESRCCARRRCSASTCRRSPTAWSGASTLNVLGLCGVLARRASRHRSSACRPTCSFPPTLRRSPPSFRLWRSSVTVEELTTTVARYLGEERTRTSFDSYRRSRGGISSSPKREADFQLLRYAEHLLASAIGAASSRLVLSLLLRKRTVSTKAALKLLDDANAAIHYNREILQTALDHVRQGIAVFDKDLHLICWNRQFGEILDLPPQLTRVGTGLDEILRFNAEHGALRPGRGRRARARAARPLCLEQRAVPGALRRARPGHGSARQSHARRRHRHDLHRHHAEREGGRGARARQRDRWSAGCRSAPRN